jgi:hypothetical protein
MKLPFAIAVIFFVLIDPVHSAETKSEAGSFAPFWAQFKAAVANKDKEAVAGMTKFPFFYRDTITRADFIKKFDVIFSAQVRKCFQSAKPTKDTNRESYTVFCGEDIFVFEKGKDGYQFTDVGVND